MSSILKALRRLEEERARKSHVAPEIAASLLRSDSRRQKSPVLIWISVSALITMMILAAFFWSWRSAATTNPTASLPPSPATLTNTSPAERGGEVIIEEVIDQRRPALLPPPTQQNDKVLPPSPKMDPVVLTPTVANKTTAVVIEERQSPIVSAIAWQDDSSARMAVVDGLPVMTGETVATAKVIEILPDRILFEEAGVRFVVRVQSP